MFRGSPDFWLNLADIGNPGNFVWMRSRTPFDAMSFGDWLGDVTGVPEALRDEKNPERSWESCVLMDNDTGSDFKWRNFVCSHEALPICEVPPITPRSRRFAKQLF